jgi:hypothetical protein
MALETNNINNNIKLIIDDNTQEPQIDNNFNNMSNSTSATTDFYPNFYNLTMTSDISTLTLGEEDVHGTATTLAVGEEDVEMGNEYPTTKAAYGEEDIEMGTESPSTTELGEEEWEILTSPINTSFREGLKQFINNFSSLLTSSPLSILQNLPFFNR